MAETRRSTSWSAVAAARSSRASSSSCARGTPCAFRPRARGPSRPARTASSSWPSAPTRRAIAASSSTRAGPPSRRVSIRILTTNDFVGSFFPQATSWGMLPGGAGLAAAVGDLRDDATLWIDTGDVAQGTALGALSDGTWGFLAMRELPVDVGVAGNHELDWGTGHLRTWARELPFPLLAANADLGLQGARLVSVGDSAVGVIGLTTREL